MSRHTCGQSSGDLFQCLLRLDTGDRELDDELEFDERVDLDRLRFLFRVLNGENNPCLSSSVECAELNLLRSKLSFGSSKVISHMASSEYVGTENLLSESLFCS